MKRMRDDDNEVVPLITRDRFVVLKFAPPDVIRLNPNEAFPSRIGGRRHISWAPPTPHVTGLASRIGHS
jgi:hypothetical protein